MKPLHQISSLTQTSTDRRLSADRSFTPSLQEENVSLRQQLAATQVHFPRQELGYCVFNGIRFNTPALNSTCEIVSKTCSDFFLSTRFPCLFSHMRAPLCCIMSLAQSQCGS